MTWTYSSRTGAVSQNGTSVGMGYSGRGAGLMNPDMESVPDVGPIPRNPYSIGPFFDDPGGKGPVVCHLTPGTGAEMYGRSGMMIHGDNSEGNHTASEGCIILARPIREQIAASGDTDLLVI